MRASREGSLIWCRADAADVLLRVRGIVLGVVKWKDFWGLGGFFMGLE